VSQPEYRIVRKIERWATSQGFWWMKVQGNEYTRAGITDLLLCVEGLFVGIEVKQPGENPSEIQKYEMGKMIAAGGHAGVAHSLEEAIRIVEVARALAASRAR